MNTKPVLLALIILGPTALRGETDQAKELGKFLAHHNYGTVYTQPAYLNKQLLQAEINGHRVTMLIDTGCHVSYLTEHRARRLKLDVVDSGKQMYGIGGEVKGTYGVALISSFKINGYEINRTNIIHVLSKYAHTDSDLDGYFGFDFLALNAVILPVGANFILFHPGSLSTIPPIDSYMTSLGYKSVPIHEVDNRVIMTGQMNGQPFTAMIDSGACCSLFSLDYVHRTSAAPTLERHDLGYDGGLDGVVNETHLFHPKEVRFGSLALERMTFTASRTTFERDGIEMLFGYDLLADHRAILDFGHGVLWMK